MDNPQPAPFKRSHKSRIWPALLVFLAGFAFLITGIYRGEVAVVLQKAIKICLECIGIG